MLADCFRLIADDLQEVGLQGPDKEAPTSRRIPRINNEPSRPTEGVRFCLSGRSAPFHQQSLFESNNDHVMLDKIMLRGHFPVICQITKPRSALSIRQTR